MNLPEGAVDCNVHLPVPTVEDLCPYLPEAWREIVRLRGIKGFGHIGAKPDSPAACRPDWLGEDGVPGGTAVDLVSRVLDQRKVSRAIVHALYPVQRIHDAPMAAAFAAAVNDYVASHWLSCDTRLSASIVVPAQDPRAAAIEIDRCAADTRFVQILMLASGDLPYGHPIYRPIWERAEAHSLPVMLHAGSAGRYPPTPSGWPTYHFELAVDDALAGQAQLASLVSHGVFNTFPELRVVLSGMGFAWLPSFGWRMSKFWRGTRIEVPWIREPPAETIRRHVRLTLRPFDAGATSSEFERVLDHLGSDEMLLFSSDYPSWHFDGSDPVPPGISVPQLARMAVENPHATYSRLGR
ncbi:MAG TPA: amidohydrolase family protein [Devosiaceae bacterium]